jgi:predicted RNA-binding protein with PIN domain
MLSDTPATVIPKMSSLAARYQLSEEDVEAIMMREFGPIRRKQYREPKIIDNGKAKKLPKKKDTLPQKKMIIIDGYNVIYSWDNLKAIAAHSLADARDALMDILDNYAAYTKMELTLVFDAYLVKDGMGSDTKRGGYRVVYTKEDQTADTFIEIMMNELGPNYNIRVVTGDRLLQNSAVVSGILRMTAKEFEKEIAEVAGEIADFIQKLRNR